MPEWIEVALRTLVSIIVLFIMTKILGKRQISQLSLFEYITGITIGSLTAYISLDIESTWFLGIVSLLVWVACSYGIELLTLKSKKMRDLIDGKGTVLIKDGKVMEENLKKERLTADELLEQLRSRNVFRVADVEFALMESSGQVNVLLTREHKSLTPSHLGIQVSPEQEPQTVIMDGKMIDEPLATLGLTREWIKVELDKIAVLLEEVFLGQVDAYGQLTVDVYNDQISVPVPQKKAALYAVLKKCEADLESFGVTAKSKKSKRMYEDCVHQLETVIAELKPILHR
ncbi:DUF421 domain-containing protein [Paenibacillus solisilvae]|uniref:DUF421 domain-containing protein n=1 Tax=Paenibacillus solisilvae TaxID=2486751 RepID=A0ABW0VW13_9BACL